ncbi:UvrD/REP helicase [Russula earlei]|uniref:UvrD/REP helicase n=1 Tax=Russula earlei TaxID=71964 RepID=A0ACC0TVB4_9AGAM|nr:UvrD/REP helicase [Russula earlei]
MASKYLQQEKYQSVYNNLNAQQGVAVDTIEGPVMVIAGPGTGKTQILSARIGKILLETDALPQNILCLTYTDAGVVAMRKRLLSFIGSDAYKVNIHTFHSFCNMVIQENIRLFNKKELEALSDLERVQFLKQLIDGFGKDNPLKRYKGEVYYDTNNLAGLFSAIKRESWQPAWLVEQVDYYTQHLVPETEGFYKKREKAKGETVLTQKGKDEVERMEKLKAAIQSFDAYQEILHRNNRYDFDDMINWVIQMFEHNKEVLLNYQEQFQYILVDEYQDTSGSQNKIVELLISYWQNESPNIFVVGDDDQSIYRFQGANLKNMMNLAQQYEKDLVTVVLTQNYRSVQPILDSAKALIENNEQRLVKQYVHLTKDLVASNATLKALSIVPEIRIYENEFAENAHIAKSIKQLTDKGVQPGKIAVIYREHRAGDELMKFLQLQQIPFYVRRSINLLEDVFTNKVLNLVRYTAAELDTPFSGDPLLFEILHYDFFQVQPAKIAAVCTEIAESRNRKKEENSLRSYLLQLTKTQAGTLFQQDEQVAALIRVSALLESLQKEVYNKTVQHWFEQLINEGGILAYIMQQEDKAWLMNKLTCLFDYIKEAAHRNPSLTLHQLVQQIDMMGENNLSLPLIQTTGTETGVNLLTAHGSKGLEYEYVFIVGARNDIWEEKRKTNRGFRLPPNVFEQETEAEATEELRRLFFVAVTRAEKYLYISYPQMKNDGKLLEPSQFVEELRQPLGIEAEKVVLTEEDKLLFSALRFGIIQKPVLEEAEKDYINRLLEKFVMNVTALNNYLDCPIRFYYSSLVRVPSAKSEAAQFGTAVHEALSDFLNHMMGNGKVYPDKTFLVNRFVYHINDGREVFTQESLQRFTEYGREILSKYYDHYYNPAPQNDFILTEYPLTKIVVNNIPVKGFTDKIQFWGNDIVITDYKTGNFNKSRLRGDFDLPGGEKKPQGGNYWRQAVFYKILVDNLPGKNWKVQYTQFDFVEPNAKDEFDIEKLAITPQEVEQVKEQVSFVWEQVQQHNFYTGCGKPECEWCNFAKNNKIYSTLIEEEEETMLN